MNLIKSLMGRRQFLIAAGAASASALTFKKSSGIFVPGSKTNGTTVSDSFASIAMVGEKARSADVKAIGNKYPHILSPLRIRNKVAKNRILSPRCDPHLLQGPENYPADSVRSFYSDMAKNVAIVHIHMSYEEMTGPFPKWDDLPACNNYVDQLIEDIHCEGSLVGIGELEGNTIEEVVTSAKEWEDKGFDVVGFVADMTDKEAVLPYIERFQAIRKATDLIIVANIRPYSPEFYWDSYRPSSDAGMEIPSGAMPEGGMRGGAMPEGGMQGGAMPEGGMQAGGAGGWTGPEVEELVEIAKMLEGSADILLMKPAGQKHQNCFTMDRDRPWALSFAQAVKESGAKIITCPNGGFHDAVLNDEWIASGKTDMICMATSLIADPEYVKKISEDRVEDIVPCLKCHDCHARIAYIGSYICSCNVNPMLGLSETKKRSISPSLRSRKVAVIGGGPAGMKAAITAAERGHRVTLYEKSEALGGLQQHTDFTKWRWPYKNYKDYLIRQLNKAGIDVKLKTTATPEKIKAKGYDAVLVAVGAEPVVPKIPGADGKNVYSIVDAYSKMKSFGKKVVIIGGGVYGFETGIVLVKEGFKVMVLTSDDCTIPATAIGPHNKQNQLWIIERDPNYDYVLEVTATRIAEGKVFYKDAAGSEKSVDADSVVIYGGLKPKTDEAMKYSETAPQVLLIGDCNGKGGTIQKSIRNAFFMASQV